MPILGQIKRIFTKLVFDTMTSHWKHPRHLSQIVSFQLTPVSHLWWHMYQWCQLLLVDASYQSRSRVVMSNRTLLGYRKIVTCDWKEGHKFAQQNFTCILLAWLYTNFSYSTIDNCSRTSAWGISWFLLGFDRHWKLGRVRIDQRICDKPTLTGFDRSNCLNLGTNRSSKNVYGYEKTGYRLAHTTISSQLTVMRREASSWCSLAA